MTQGFPGDGPTFDKLCEKLGVMCAAVEAAFPNPNRKPRPVGRTLVEQAQAWHALPSPLAAKTKDQYLNDATLFQAWFVSATRKSCVGATITKKDVNAYVASRMKLNEHRARINRRLAGCAKIYKSGQFGDDNPFVGVSSRIDIHGPKLKVRPFTDPEVAVDHKGVPGVRSERSVGDEDRPVLGNATGGDLLPQDRGLGLHH